MAPAPLRLLAEDADDLQVLSAALQDAVVKVGDIRWESKARRLTLEVNRFRWEDAGRPERVRSGLQLGSVLAVKARNIRTGVKDAVLELLAVRFEAGEAPSGQVVFEFADGGDLSAEVECLEAVLADLTGSWPAKREPCHDADKRKGA